MNRIKTLIESGQRTTTYTYNPKGLLEEIRKPDGVALKNTYDKIGRLQIQTSSDQSIHYVYKYNRVDQLIKVEDLITKTKTIRKYDPLGNLLYEQLGNQLTLTNTYDERSRRQTLALPDERTVSFSYDALHLRSVSYEDYTHQFNTYDLAGHLIQETPIGSLGISFDYTYDIAAKPLSFSSPYFHHHILSYDPVGNIRSARFPSENITYDYDALYHLTLEKGQTTHNYAYDSLHNRLQKDQETYQVDRLNQITSVFTYDKNGNPISKNNAIYSYDAFDRLISIELPSTLLQFTYDFDHRRLTKMVYHKSANDWNLAQTLYFLYDGHREIGAFDAQGTPLELRILGRSEESERGSSVMFKLEGETFIPIHDLSGNIRAIISPQARTIETLSYTTFGEEVTPSPIPWKFSSKRYDPESGLYYYGRRYYDPALGRWLTPDPQGYNDGLNLYAFVQNNPLTHFDSYGLWARPIFSAPTFSPPRFDPPKIESTWQATTGFITATTDCALNTGAFASDVGFAVTIPARFIYNHTLGNSTLSKDWQQHQYNQRYLIQQSQRWLQAQLHADPQNSYYRYSRQIASPAVEVTSLYYLGGPKLVKYGITVCQEGILLARRYLSSLKNSNVTTSARLAALESRTASLSIHRQAGKLSIENPKPIWSATKDQTSVRNAYRHWKDHGSEFPELLNAKQYVEQAHKLFKSKKDYILTKTRPNGEHLIYDVQTNTFGAFVEDGTPKTMFKPIKGITYWETRN